MNDASKERMKLDLGKVLQSIDNEKIVVDVDGKRKRLPRAEVYFRHLFAEAIGGDLASAKLIANMAAKYFGSEAEGPAEVEFVIVPDDERYPSGNETDVRAKETIAGDRKPPESARSKKGRSKKQRGQPRQAPQQVSTGSLFRKIALAQVPTELEGKRSMMLCWDVYLRRIYAMALNKNNGADLLLYQIRRQFPGDLLPGDKLTFLLYESDAEL